jgi:uncharacterized CHY-type Zn-finger protein
MVKCPICGLQVKELVKDEYGYEWCKECDSVFEKNDNKKDIDSLR